MYEVSRCILPVDRARESEGAKRGVCIECDNVVSVIIPRVSVSVEEGRTEQEVEVAREGANLRLHLPSIPHSWALLVVLVPGVEDLVGILSDEGVGLHQQTNLTRTIEPRKTHRKCVCVPAQCQQ